MVLVAFPSQAESKQSLDCSEIPVESNNISAYKHEENMTNSVVEVVVC